MRLLLIPLSICVFHLAWADNSCIEFGQFEKVRRVCIAAGALYACGKDESIPWEKRIAYQFMHFKLEQVVDGYFKIAYRITAIQDVPIAERVRIIDEHKKVEAQRDALQQAGVDELGKGMKCQDVGSFSVEVLKYQ